MTDTSNICNLVELGQGFLGTIEIFQGLEVRQLVPVYSYLFVSRIIWAFPCTVRRLGLPGVDCVHVSRVQNNAVRLAS